LTDQFATHDATCKFDHSVEIIFDQSIERPVAVHECEHAV